ncbi:hypothetical protein KSP39_PZI007492 [Platanthera zijinensis]|uniref:Uncharacterized protein n=1 Tax=Platanthera zijinensis TaxID=2320716 RepID=A0AAP0BPF2_9ASPA
MLGPCVMRYCVLLRLSLVSPTSVGVSINSLTLRMLLMEILRVDLLQTGEGSDGILEETLQVFLATIAFILVVPFLNTFSCSDALQCYLSIVEPLLLLIRRNGGEVKWYKRF